MRTLYLILYIIAAACFAIAAFIHTRARTDIGTPGAHRPGPLTTVYLVALGLLAWVLVPLINTIDILAD